MPVKTTLLESAPFKIVGHCFKKGEEVEALTYLTLIPAGTTGFVSESNEGEGVPFKAGEEIALTSEPAIETPGEALYVGPSEGLFSGYVPAGEHSIDGAVNDGVSLEGKAKPACYFSGFAVAG